jgi:glucose/arabinose dehydrogenase
MRVFSRVAIVACLLFLALTLSTNLAAQTFTDPRFTAETVVDMAPYAPEGFLHAPDGRMFIWSKAGEIWVYNGQGQPTSFLDIQSRVNIALDRGLIGFALDPDFATNGYFYVAYVFEDAGARTSDLPRSQRVSRFQRDPNNPNVALPNSETVILGTVSSAPCADTSDCMPNDMGAHSVDHIAFGPDGKLYVSVGDGASYKDADVNTFRAQNLDSLDGKILRVNPDGTGPSDNPFFNGDPNANRSKVFAYGLRNPFRFSFDSQGRLWVGDVGWTKIEELNMGRAANFGWPCFEGPSPQPEFQYRHPELCSVIPQTATALPRFSYEHTVGSTVVAGPVYRGTAYPIAYQDRLFFADYTSGWIRSARVNADGTLTDVQIVATNVVGPVFLELGPDGMLYYSSFSAGDIMRVRFTAAGNRAPVAKASASPSAGPSPLTVTFTGDTSSDPDLDPLSYHWDFGDGTESFVANPSKTYSSDNQTTVTATLTVTDPFGASNSATVPVTVGSTPPNVSILEPADGTVVRQGQLLNFRGTANDPEDGPLTGTKLEWTVFLEHNTHEHLLPGWTGETGSLTVQAEDQFDRFAYRVVFTATDSSGLKSSQQIILPIDNRPVPCTVNTATDPNVTICWPTEGQVMSTTQVRILGTAYSSTGIQKIDVFVNGQFSQTVTGNEVDRLLQLNPGNYTLELRATDGLNVTHTATRSFSVEANAGCFATGTAPSITLCSPSDASTVSPPVRVQAAVNSTTGIVATKVYVDNLLTYSTAGGLVDTLLDLPPGAHGITIQFWDNSGAVTKKSAVFNVSGSSGGTAPCTPLASAPSVRICTPAVGSTVPSPTRITAAVNSTNGVLSTKVYLDNALVNSVTGPNVDTTFTIAPGTHFLTVQFWDKAGNVTKQSETFSVGSTTGGGGSTCTAAPAPSVTICTPADGATVSSPLNLKALFASNNGVVASKVYVGSTQVYSGGSGSTLEIPLTLAAGTRTITVQFWDRSGVVTKKTLTVNVSGVGGGTTGCTSPSTDNTIKICSPTQGSTVASPMRVIAAITSSSGVTSAKIYVNNSLAYSAGATKNIDAQIPAAAGPKNIVVQYWNQNGQVFKQSVNATVQ